MKSLILFAFISITAKSQSINSILSECSVPTADLYPIMKMDVFQYFHLSYYDTDLKKSVFEKSSEYKKYYDSLRAVKSAVMKKSYYVYRNAFAKEDEFITAQKEDEDVGGNVNYDVKRKGFRIILGQNTAIGGTYSRHPPKSLKIKDSKDYMTLSINWVYLKSLPVKVEQNYFLGQIQQGVFDEVLFIPTTEQIGLAIEEHRTSKIYFIFSPSGMETVSYKFYNAGDATWYTSKDDLIKADRVRIVIGDETSSKVYFDKSYAYSYTAAKPAIKK